MLIDIRVLELLSSKICHDLVSPVSAINNGVELIEDIGGTVVEEAMKLIGDSAGHASRRLRLFRMAYGRAGGEENFAVKDVRQTAEQYLAGGKTMLTWPDDVPGESASHRGFLKVLLNITIMSEEILAYGGVVTLRALPDGESGCRAEIVGRGAQLTPVVQDALENKTTIDELTPRTIQSYLTGLLASHFKINVRHEQPMADRLDLILTPIKPEVTPLI